MNPYQQVEQIGEGTYGSVFLAQCHETHTMVALKKIKQQKKEGFPLSAIREIKILKTLNHVNVLRLLDVVSMNGDAFMVLEFCDHDLAGLMEANEVTLSESLVKYYIKCILEGLKYCHENNVIHRDIKAANILISNNGDVKLADYGLARFIDTKYIDSKDGCNYTNRVVTLWYRAPELLLADSHYSSKIDIWSAGCLLAEMLTGSPLFSGHSYEAAQLGVIYDICGTPNEEEWPEVKELKLYQEFPPKQPLPSRLATHLTQHGVRPSAIDLLDKMLTLCPTKRYTAEEALHHPYFKEVDIPIMKQPDHPIFPGNCFEYETKLRRRREREEEKREEQSRQELISGGRTLENRSDRVDKVKRRKR